MPITAYKICQYPTAETLGITYMKPTATIFEGSFENAKAILEATAEELGLYQSGWTLENFDEDYCLVIEEVYDEVMQNFIDRVKMAENSHALDSIKAEASEDLSVDDWYILSEIIADRRSFLELNDEAEVLSDITSKFAVTANKYTVSAVTGEIIYEHFVDEIVAEGGFNDMIAVITGYYADYIKVGAKIHANSELIQATIPTNNEAEEICYSYSLRQIVCCEEVK